MNLFNIVTKIYAQTTNTVIPLVPDFASSEAQTGIEGYVKDLFPKLIQFGVAIAILTMTYWGLRKIISNVPGFKTESSERMTAALLGLGILLIAWLVLNTINPEIFKASLDKIGGQ